MRAMRLARPALIESDPLELMEVADLRPAPLELTIQIKACGVCRTDLQIAEGDLPARRLPIIPGHQAVGRVVAVGAGVDGWAVGDRAGVGWMAGVCGDCSFCASGRENLCTFARFTGWDRDGGFAEQINVRADFAFRLPEGLSDMDLAPLLCGGVIGYRSLHISGIQPGGRLGLFGFGASASLAIQVATYWNCDVFVFTRSESEKRRAIDLGAVWAGGYGDDPGEALDAAVTFAPVGSVVVSALQTLDRGATVAINAIHLDGMPAFDYDDLWLERQIRSVANFTRRDVVEFLELAAKIPIRTSWETFPLHLANEALAALNSGTVSGAAVLVVG
ncbi:MAG: zinc-dependent alcohol dehydrogenase family protein [Acidimicrobiia bacterium]|nr:zinc-dependent alcohol dehydrogenase family protein [Acidimicrobiia bacterium]